MDSLLFIPETHEYIVDGVTYPSVTQVIGSCGLSGLENVDKRLLERNAAFGNAVHKAIELSCKGTLDSSSVDEAIKSYIKQWDKFCADFDFESSIQELRSFHQVLRVGYTIDHIGRMDGHTTIVDIKTGAPKASDVIQACAYGYMYPAKRLVLLYLQKENNYKIIEIKGQDRKKGERIFLSCLALYNFKKDEGLL